MGYPIFSVLLLFFGVFYAFLTSRIKFVIEILSYIFFLLVSSSFVRLKLHTAFTSTSISLSNRVGSTAGYGHYLKKKSISQSFLTGEVRCY